MTSYRDLSDLSGRTSLITGAAGRLGAVFATTLAELGSDLILVDLPETRLEALRQKIELNSKCHVAIVYVNLEKDNQRKKLIEDVTLKYDNLNVLVNNAAIVGSDKLDGWSTSFETQKIESWRRAFEVNVTAVFDLCQGFVPIMKRSKGASIINIASIYGQLGPDWRLYAGTNMGNPAAYASSKGALIQLTRWLSTTLAPNVRANAICPGGIDRDQPSNFVTSYSQRTPQGRMAQEQDLIGAIGYLASDLSSYVTGQVINVDGGWSAW